MEVMGSDCHGRCEINHQYVVEKLQNISFRDARMRKELTS